jgi:hypothetical protein
MNVEAIAIGTWPTSFVKASIAHEIGHTHTPGLTKDIHSDPDIAHGLDLLKQPQLRSALLEKHERVKIPVDSLADMVHAMNATLVMETEAWNHGSIAATAMGLETFEYENYEHKALSTYWYSTSRMVLAAWQNCRKTDSPKTLLIYNPFLQDAEELTLDQLQAELDLRKASDANNAAIAVNTIAPGTLRKKVGTQ